MTESSERGQEYAEAQIAKLEDLLLQAETSLHEKSLDKYGTLLTDLEVLSTEMEMGGILAPELKSRKEATVLRLEEAERGIEQANMDTEGDIDGPV